MRCFSASARSSALLWLGLVGGCAPTFESALCIGDVDGTPLEGAEVILDGVARLTDARGRVSIIGLEHPELAVVDAEGFLARPIVLDETAPGECIEVQLLSSAGGSRRVVHFGGDMMFGRRYLEPEEGPALIVPGDGGESARAVVSDLAESFSQADLGVANLECVIGDFSEEEAYPSKRWLLQSPVESLAALDELGVGVVVLGNNHQRDWLDPGVQSTLEQLDGSAYFTVGGGESREEAEAALVVEVSGMRIGMLSWTSVDGAYVNDAYPTLDAEPPADLPEEEAWLWELRSWGYPEQGIEVEERRIGDAWQAIDEVIDDLSEQEAAALWESARQTFPELQDWVARWGHGGAAVWDEDRAEEAIAQLQPEVDLLVAQIHMGMQFAEVPSGNARSAARAAIDAGADIVIGHHPHVLQGMEWYKDRLIVYSLGNFVFDQDFHSTFPSGYLRTVWESDGSLVQARFVPLWIDGYRPTPITGEAAESVLRTVWDRSWLPATARRGADSVPRAVVEPLDAATEPVGMRLEHGTGVLTRGVGDRELVQLVPVEEYGALPADGLVRRDVGDELPPDLWVGRDLLGAGDFEDADTDASSGDTRLWYWSSQDVRLTTEEAGEGRQSLELVRDAANSEVVQARPVARVDLYRHRLFADEDGEQALDSAASYSISALARVDGELGLASARIDLYSFYDLDPTVAPVSTGLRQVEVELEIEALGEWQRVFADLPADLLDPVDGLEPNAALIYLRLAPPERDTTVLRLDDVQLVEWREAAGAPGGYVAADWLRWPGQSGWISVHRLSW